MRAPESQNSELLDPPHSQSAALFCLASGAPNDKIDGAIGRVVEGACAQVARRTGLASGFEMVLGVELGRRLNNIVKIVFVQ